jgi:hypothetical protein
MPSGKSHQSLPFKSMPTIERNPTIDTPPLHPGGGPSEYTEYKIASAADREAVRQDVLRVAGNGSFVSRCLLVISRQGSSKNFVTITGEDGLTFGIKDFISDSVRSLLLDMEKRAPGTLATVFGSQAGDVVDAKFLAQHTDKATDRGLIGIGWLRVGIDQVLCDRRFHGVQLRKFVEEAVRPSLDTFEQAGFQLAFSAAAMVGVANSFGAGGMVNRLARARERVGAASAMRPVRFPRPTRSATAGAASVSCSRSSRGSNKRHLLPRATSYSTRRSSSPRSAPRNRQRGKSGAPG